MSRAAESSRKHTVGVTDSVVSQMNVFGMLPVVPQVVDRLTITSIESWGERSDLLIERDIECNLCVVLVLLICVCFQQVDMCLLARVMVNCCCTRPIKSTRARAKVLPQSCCNANNWLMERKSVQQLRMKGPLFAL